MKKERKVNAFWFLLLVIGVLFILYEFEGLAKYAAIVAWLFIAGAINRSLSNFRDKLH